MQKSSGFTVIELIFVVVLIAAASILFFIQKNDIELAARDNQRKTAINSLYYGLEEIYYKQHSAYPRQLSSETLNFVDPEIFIDPNGIKLGQTSMTIDDQEYAVQSDYSYEGTNCDDDKCQSYTLKTKLEKEADFSKNSRHQ